MVSEFYNGYVKENNKLFGILICALITAILFVIIPQIAFIFPGDIHLLIGTCVGQYFTFKNRKETQSYIKLGVIVGAAGAFLALILDAVFYWIAYALLIGFDVLLYLLISLAFYSGIMYIITGIIIGIFFGIGFRNRATREESPLL